MAVLRTGPLPGRLPGRLAARQASSRQSGRLASPRHACRAPRRPGRQSVLRPARKAGLPSDRRANLL